MKHRGNYQPLRNKPREREHVDINNENDNYPRLQDRLWDRKFTIPRVKPPQQSVMDDNQEEDSEYMHTDSNLIRSRIRFT